MKFIDLTKLDMKRLKTYRKSVTAKICGFELCSCGSLGCDFGRNSHRDNPNYINLKIVRERINKELAKRQRDEFEKSKNVADVRTIRQLKRGTSMTNREFKKWKERYEN